MSIRASLRGTGPLQSGELGSGINAKGFTLHSSPHEWAHCREQSGSSMRIHGIMTALASCPPDLRVPGRAARRAGLEEGSSLQGKEGDV